jgi:hypothetical protein
MLLLRPLQRWQFSARNQRQPVTLQILSKIPIPRFREERHPTWLSAALTNQDTCLNGFRDFSLTTSSNIKSLLSSRVLNVSELLSNSLSMYKLSSRSADSLKNRRLLSLEREEEFHSHYGRIEDSYNQPQIEDSYNHPARPARPVRNCTA